MSLYNVWSRPFIARSDPLAFLTAGMGAAAFCLLVWALAIHGFDAVAQFGMPQWIAIAYIGIIGSAVHLFCGCLRCRAPVRPRLR